MPFYAESVQVLAIRNDLPLVSKRFFSLIQKTKARLEHLVQSLLGDNSFKTKCLRESCLAPEGRRAKSPDESNPYIRN